MPDSVSDELGNHGSVCVRIEHVEPLLPGAIIQNSADIYFDFNPPVITGPSVLVADLSTGLHDQFQARAFVFPNPTSENLVIRSRNVCPVPSEVDVVSSDGRSIRLSAEQSGLVDVQGPAPGLYTVRVGNQQVRFIKQ